MSSRRKRRLDSFGDFKTYNRAVADRYEEGDQKTPDRTLGLAMRKVFLDTPDGRYVLGALLTHWGYFREATSIEDVLEQKIGKELLWYMGVWHEDNVLDILEKLQTVRPRWFNEKNDTQ